MQSYQINTIHHLYSRNMRMRANGGGAQKILNCTIITLTFVFDSPPPAIFRLLNCTYPITHTFAYTLVSVARFFIQDSKSVTSPTLCLIMFLFPFKWGLLWYTLLSSLPNWLNLTL